MKSTIAAVIASIVLLGFHQDNERPYCGKFRGVVVNNLDPEGIGRILVRVPDVSQQPIPSWAFPCVPYSGKQVGLLALPPIGATVWVEFESGNPDLPIWVEGYWQGRAEAPGQASAAARSPKSDCTADHADQQERAGFGGAVRSSALPPTAGVQLESAAVDASTRIDGETSVDD